MPGEVNRIMTDQEVAEQLYLELAQELVRIRKPVEVLTGLTQDQRDHVQQLMNDGHVVLD